MRRIIKWAAAIGLILTISVGCDKKEDKYVTGSDYRDTVRSQYGEPEDVNTYDSGTYWSETWWYWTKGLSTTFTKSVADDEKKSGGFLGCSKDTTTTHTTSIILDSSYTFTPISSPLKGTGQSPSKIILPRDTIRPGPGSMGPM